ncbi:MAG: vWA domain-containing protein [Planctomycetaceae bacterium]
MLFRSVPALVISVVTHAVVLLGLFLWTFTVAEKPPKLLVETVFMDEREQEEFSQEMAIDTSVSKTLSATAGGAVTGAIGSAAGNPMPTQNIEVSDALKNPTINVTQFAAVTTSGIGDINMDLGEGEVSGEIGARVEGYGAAMHRMTQELRRMMRKEKVLVVWLFDASYSLKDDRQEIADNFSKIYEELDIARQQADRSKDRYHAIETMVCSFGDGIRELTPKPTADLKEIVSAIERVDDDKSGKELTFTSIMAILEKYGKMARSTDRKLAIMVLTDETGDDAEGLELVVDKAKLYKAPVYFLGREAIFGYPYAKMEWINPETKVTYWINVDRGPETAMPEALQYNGFGGRWDSASSGFAPYSQARLVKESGGIFFMLQTEEKDLIGQAARLERKFDDIRMKQYEPDLEPVREYVQVRDKSSFRKAIWTIILRLNPHLDGDLNIRDHYDIDYAEFEKQGREPFQRGLRALQLMNTAIAEVEKLRPERDVEPDARWRAAYDLVYAQLLSYRVRGFQYLLAMDNQLREKPKPKSPKSNYWDREYTGKMIEPTPEQIKITGVDTAELEAQRLKALETYDFIIAEHPGTPWAQRAEQEKRWGFGIHFIDRYWDPKRFDPAEIAKVPKF